MVNLGTPEKTDFLSMWKYLREFLSDKRIIELTRIIWFPFIWNYSISKARKVWEIVRLNME